MIGVEIENKPQKKNKRKNNKNKNKQQENSESLNYWLKAHKKTLNFCGTVDQLRKHSDTIFSVQLLRLNGCQGGTRLKLKPKKLENHTSKCISAPFFNCIVF